MEHINYDRIKGIVFNTGTRTIAIHDVRGKLVWDTRNDYQDAILQWDGKDNSGEAMQGGDYICKIEYFTGKTVYVPFVLLP